MVSRATERIEAGEAVLTEAPLLLAPNKLEKPFGRVHALYDLEPAARRTLLTELFAKIQAKIGSNRTWRRRRRC